MTDSIDIVISIVTIVRNDASHIAHTIESVIHQDYPFKEYIVVDGASTDGTQAVIERYASSIQTYISEPDKGIYNAMNKGLRLATGHYVIFMNCGDCFTGEHVLSEIANSISQSKGEPAMVYGDYRAKTKDGYSPQIPSFPPGRIWYGTMASHQSTFYNLNFLRTHNLCYDESYKIAADYKLNIECIHRSRKNVLQLHVCVSDFDTMGVSNIQHSLGLSEADRARKEALGMNVLYRKGIIVLQLMMRFIRFNLYPLYKLIRH